MSDWVETESGVCDWGNVFCGVIWIIALSVLSAIVAK